MHYAITITADGLITDRHESMRVISADMFAESEYYAGQEVVEISHEDEYQGGHWLDEYVGGKILPLVDRIIMGRDEAPPGYEMIDGELVAVEKPIEEQPESVRDEIARIDSQAKVEQKAARVMFRTLAQTDVIAAADALDNTEMFPLWADNIGQRAEAGSYWRHADKLYRVNAGQGHTIQADWPPDQAASLFSLAANPAEECPEWIQPTGAHNAYAKGAKVSHNGQRWISDYEANTWVPSVYGWVVQ